MTARALLAALAAALVLPSAALGATATVTSAGAIAYTAAAGEVNEPSLSLSIDRRAVTVRDPGAAIAAGDGCTAVDEHQARCAVPENGSPVTVALDLGDGDDVVTGLTLLGALVDIDAGRGNDRVDARAADVRGGDGDDVLQASGTLEGGPGDDVLLGGFASDTLAGGPGRDRIDGGPGSDTVSWADETRPVTIDLGRPGPAGPADEPDDVRNVESAIGGSGPDVLRGTDGANQLTGGAGDDRLDGLGGGDWLDGGRGTDRLRGGAGRDQLIASDVGPGGAGDLLDGGPDGDWIKSESAGSVVLGGAGGDSIEFAGRVRRVDGGPGADWLTTNEISGSGAFVRCGAGADRIEGLPATVPVPADCDTAMLRGGVEVVLPPRLLRRGRLAVPLPRDCLFGTCPLRVDVLADGRRLAGARVALHRAFPSTAVLRLSRAAQRRLRRSPTVFIRYRRPDAGAEYGLTVPAPR